MTSKQYLLRIAAIVTTFCLTFAGINFYADDFGLWGNDKELRIWGLEKTSKYLLSFRYVPDNFDGVIVGPSLSSNMDTRAIEGFKVYNLSMNGANISEISYLTNNLLPEGKIDFIVISMHRYLTQDSGRKGQEIDPREYYGSLLSTLPLKIWFYKFVIRFGMAPDRFHSSEWGYDDSNVHRQGIKFKDVIAKRKSEKPIVMDPTAVKQLKELLELARRNNVRVFAYYFPIWHEWQNEYKVTGQWDSYKSAMDSLFTEDDIVWDMNTPEYDYIRKNIDNYSDGHLSNQGAELVIKDINRVLHEHM